MRLAITFAVISLFMGVLFSSCAFKQQQLLFQRADTSRSAQDYSGAGTSDYRIKSQDILQIRNLQSTRFIVDEAPTTVSVGGSGNTGSGATAGTASQGQTYQVEDDGTVALPVIGHVQVAGLTRAEAAKHE